MFWVAMWIVESGPSLMVLTILKFLTYVSVIMWCNSAYFLRALAIDQISGYRVEIDSWEFQKEQIKLTLWIVCLLIWMELPLMLASLGSTETVSAW